MENLLVRGTERIAYGYVDSRALDRLMSPPPEWMSLCWMAASCMSGIEGPAQRCDHALPVPDPRPVGW